MKKPHIGKKTAIVTSVIVLGLIGGVSAEVANKPKAGADTSPLVTEVDQQNDKLNNHEARISNLEGDTKTLQDRTGATPSTHVDVPVVRSVTAPTSTAQPTPTADTPTPVTVVSYREIVIDSDTSDCEYTYSDSTTYQFHWKTSNPQGSWVTDGSGGNGHWQKTIQTNGYCDNRALGQTKTN